MKILKNETYTRLQCNKDSLKSFIIAVKIRLRDLEKKGRVEFVKNDPGSGISEWKFKDQHVIFNEFTDKFDGFGQFIVDNERNVTLSIIPTHVFLKFLYK
jgi:hypothetical protein